MISSIVVGTDGSETAAVAVAHAIELARALGARLQVVSAYEPVPEGPLRSERLRAPREVQSETNGREDVLALLGNKGMTGATRFLLGSVPNKVSHHAPCSVLIVRTS